MIKKLLTFILIILSMNFVACFKISQLNNKKPSNFYYTNLLYEAINKSEFTISILDTNVYSEIIVDKEDNKVIIDMISNLKKEYFSENLTLPPKPLYKLYIENKKNKFVIDIYGDNLISIYPWDGTYIKDYISLKDIPNAFKLEQFCKYVFEK